MNVVIKSEILYSGGCYIALYNKIASHMVRIFRRACKPIECI